MSTKTPPGVFDILPLEDGEPWKQQHLWNHVETIMRRLAAVYGFKEIRTPTFERTELFQRGVGEGTDIVSKEMYTFEDKGNRSLTLRPEGTAPVVRAYIEHHIQHKTPLFKGFYIGPMFRYERSQAGRYRQHHQFGVEVIGSEAPEQDAELIDMQYSLYKALGLKNLHVQVNSIGDRECRKKYREALYSFLKEREQELSAESQERLNSNPMRVLDSKDEKDRAVVAIAPSILDFLSNECRSHFEQVLKSLDLLKIPYTVNDKIVRGLDYYTRTVYEITAEELGAQNSIGGGGRYDGLVKMLGGPSVPATGFATGIERIIQTMLAQGIQFPKAKSPSLYLIPLGEKAKTACFHLLHQLREEGIKAEMDFSGRKLGKVMGYADLIRARYVAVIGDEELQNKTVTLKEMETGEKIEAPLYHLSRLLRFESLDSNLAKLWQEINTPFEHPLESKFLLTKLQRSIKTTQNITSQLETAIKSIEDIIE